MIENRDVTDAAWFLVWPGLVLNGTNTIMARAVAWRMAGLSLDREDPSPLVDQISRHVEAAIANGSLAPGGRLPSWRDLAAQLGVARGTVQAAYERLSDRGLLVTAGSAGTRVVDPLPVKEALATTTPSRQDPRRGPDHASAFQMGVPAHDAFPATLWSRLHRQGVQATSLWTGHSDGRGLSELRSALASHVAIARGITCSPEQIIVTSGFRAGLALAIRAMDVTGRQAWLEDPGYPVARLAVEVSGVVPIPVQIDEEGLSVRKGYELAPRAALAIVTPGQQAPSGLTMTQNRRSELVQWASRSDAWIVEDDYLAELHLSGRSANALASGGGADRVVHIGSFSKTISPLLGVGFLVAPERLVDRMIDVASWLGAPPNVAVQLALARFLQEGHYLRHLRRMRRLYAQRQNCLLDALARREVHTAIPSGLSVLLPLPAKFDDQRLSSEARDAGLGTAPLSPWFATASRRSGLMLGIANVIERTIDRDCTRLLGLIADQTKKPARWSHDDCFSRPSTFLR
ncbi:PLP-dependent aminotransferase family protein [Bradyrhizobium tropiciagri]|uniref:MocR-like pyridoxine biosynthesis transcription factor PdxR n=1 Tax=Bradyrhizobium tropiciagri TaxID=312253 RepID=UPI000A512E7A|nr:PLP-dependent aminotransferase family protein [Bradyrhizobium tropiciagri]